MNTHTIHHRRAVRARAARRATVYRIHRSLIGTVQP